MFKIILTIYTEKNDKYGTKQKFKTKSFGPFTSIDIAKNFMESLVETKIISLKKRSLVELETNLNRDRLSITRIFSSTYQCFDYCISKI
ncbi:MAG: hypothetical protein ACRCYE_08540 [Sarcina sp.]